MKIWHIYFLFYLRKGNGERSEKEILEKLPDWPLLFSWILSKLLVKFSFLFLFCFCLRWRPSLQVKYFTLCFANIYSLCLLCLSVIAQDRNSLMSNMIRNAMRTIKYIWIQAAKLPCNPSQETVQKYYVCTRMNPADKQSLHLVPYVTLPFMTNTFSESLAS